jgi:hypothetical protein
VAEVALEHELLLQVGIAKVDGGRPRVRRLLRGECGNVRFGRHDQRLVQRAGGHREVLVAGLAQADLPGVFGGGNVGGAGGIGEAGQFEEGLLRLAAGRVAVVGLVNGRRA